MTDERPIRVLYIGGEGRSGSTILDYQLGDLLDGFSGGEIRFLWERSLRQNRPCSCGVPFRDCSFWQAVGREAFGGWERVDIEEVVRLWQGVNRLRFIPKALLSPKGSLLRKGVGIGNTSSEYFAPQQKGWARFIEILNRLYRAIAVVSGAKAIIDSSKDFRYACLLRLVPSLDIYIVHLVRDARGVAYSWLRSAQKANGSPKHTPVETALRWVIHNLAFEMLPLFHRNVLRIRYEDFATNPAGTLRLISDWVFDTQPHLKTANASSPTAEAATRCSALEKHMVSGNRVRFNRISMEEVKLDQEWLNAMGLPQRAAVTLFSLPLLAKYGYIGRDFSGGQTTVSGREISHG